MTTWDDRDEIDLKGATIERMRVIIREESAPRPLIYMPFTNQGEGFATPEQIISFPIIICGIWIQNPNAATSQFYFGGPDITNQHALHAASVTAGGTVQLQVPFPGVYLASGLWVMSNAASPFNCTAMYRECD